MVKGVTALNLITYTLVSVLDISVTRGGREMFMHKGSRDKNKDAVSGSYIHTSVDSLKWKES